MTVIRGNRISTISSQEWPILSWLEKRVVVGRAKLATCRSSPSCHFAREWKELACYWQLVRTLSVVMTGDLEQPLMQQPAQPMLEESSKSSRQKYFSASHTFCRGLGV